MIEVWHMRQFSGWGDERAWPAEFIKVADVETDSLDLAYQLTNHIERAWFENAGVTVYGAPKLRSTSVGDVLVRNGLAYRCASAGWTRITPIHCPECYAERGIPIPAICPHEDEVNR